MAELRTLATMPAEELLERTIEFSGRVIRLAQALETTSEARVLARQLVKS